MLRQGDTAGSCAPQCADLCLEKSSNDLPGCRAYTATANTTGDCCCGMDTVDLCVNGYCDDATNGCICYPTTQGDLCEDVSSYFYSCQDNVVELTSVPKELEVDAGDLNFQFLELAPATSDVTMKVFVRGDIDSVYEFYAVSLEGNIPLGDAFQEAGIEQCDVEYSVATFEVSQADFNDYVAFDDMLEIVADASTSVNTFCDDNDMYIQLMYTVDECLGPS